MPNIDFELTTDYIERITSDVQIDRRLKVVVDCGNGIAGASAPAIFRALGCEVIELFSEVDGNFPNHHPDPSKPENLRDLIAALQASDAELGLAFDGDGDRLGVVTFAPGAAGVTVTVSFDAEETHSEEQQRGGWQAILDSFSRHVTGKLAAE